MNYFPENMGKLLIYTGAILVIAGVIFLLLGRIGFFRLPGDIDMQGRNWRVFVPITSSILLSIVLTLILWLIGFLRR